MNILRNFVPHKLLKFNYKQPPWMNLKISSSLMKRVKLTKLFYKNPSDSLKGLLMSKSTECSYEIFWAKEKRFNHKNVFQALCFGLVSYIKILR